MCTSAFHDRSLNPSGQAVGIWGINCPCQKSSQIIMTRKRKRHHADFGPLPRKRGKGQQCDEEPCANQVNHPTLSIYYPTILTLRSFIFSRLPATSKKRRRKIQAIKKINESCARSLETSSSLGPLEAIDSSDERHLSRLLDHTLVCLATATYSISRHSADGDFKAFSQRNDSVDESSILEGSTSQSDVSC